MWFNKLKRLLKRGTLWGGLSALIFKLVSLSNLLVQGIFIFSLELPDHKSF